MSPPAVIEAYSSTSDVTWLSITIASITPPTPVPLVVTLAVTVIAMKSAFEEAACVTFPPAVTVTYSPVSAFTMSWSAIAAQVRPTPTFEELAEIAPAMMRAVVSELADTSASPVTSMDAPFFRIACVVLKKKMNAIAPAAESVPPEPPLIAPAIASA